MKRDNFYSCRQTFTVVDKCVSSDSCRLWGFFVVCVCVFVCLFVLGGFPGFCFVLFFKDSWGGGVLKPKPFI